MKILLTGGSGFIGKHLADELLKDHDLYVIGTKPDISDVISFKGSILPYLTCSYTVSAVDNIIKDIRPDALVNLAAQRLEAGKNDLSSYIVNLFVSSNIFQACQQNNVNNVVNISTIGVYSSYSKQPWAENDKVLPANQYGLSKSWVEYTSEFFNQKGMGIKTLRLGQVIGLGEREGYALQVYLNNAMKGLPITIFGQCKGKRHYVYVKDVISAIKASLLKPELSGIYNIGMDKVYGFDELANTVNSVFGNKSQIVFNKKAKADENIYQMSIEKAKNELEWKPVYDLFQTYLDIKNDIALSK